MRIEPKLDKVRIVSENMAGAVYQTSSDNNLRFRVNLGLTEAITNSIVHGCRDADDGVVTVDYEELEGRHIFHIMDPGPGPDNDEYLNPKLDDDLMSECHRGSVMIHWAADEIHCDASDNGFKLTLVFVSRPSES